MLAMLQSDTSRTPVRALLLLLAPLPVLMLLLSGCRDEPVGHEEGAPCNRQGQCLEPLVCCEDGKCHRECAGTEGEGEGCTPMDYLDATCDGMDDDCDGTADEDYVPITSCGVGYCRQHNTPSSCVDGEETACQPGAELTATDATCNGVDDDCDGSSDEDYVPTTSCGVGYCRQHSTPSTCVAGVETACRPRAELSATDPTCDGIDDDCSGTADEDVVGTCCLADGDDPPCNGCPAGTVVPAGWVCVPPGTFTMGSPEDEIPGHGRWDEIQHEATITRPFLMQSTEVTQGQWSSLMETSPSHFGACGADCPVESVGWWEAVSHCNALSDREGLPRCYELSGCSGTLGEGCGGEWYCPGYWCSGVVFSGVGCAGYRLPTEAEWEYAARALAITATYGGDLDDEHLLCDQPTVALDGIAWFCGNSGPTPHPVATKAANGWGLSDMLGNVWEWCWDWYGVYPVDPPGDYAGPEAGSGRVIRGGSWGSLAEEVRAAHRGNYGPGYRDDFIGFRPVRLIP